MTDKELTVDEVDETNTLEDPDSVDRVLLADIAAEKREHAEEATVSDPDKEQTVFQQTIIRDIAPRGSSLQQINSLDDIDRYDPSHATVTLDTGDEEWKIQVDWEKLEEITFWYTGDNRVSSLLGETVRFDTADETITHPSNAHSRIHRAGHRLMMVFYRLGLLAKDPDEGTVTAHPLTKTALPLAVGFSLLRFVQLLPTWLPENLAGPVTTPLGGVIFIIWAIAGLVGLGATAYGGWTTLKVVVPRIFRGLAALNRVED